MGCGGRGMQVRVSAYRRIDASAVGDDGQTGDSATRVERRNAWRSAASRCRRPLFLVPRVSRRRCLKWRLTFAQSEYGRVCCAGVTLEGRAGGSRVRVDIGSAAREDGREYAAERMRPSSCRLGLPNRCRRRPTRPLERQEEWQELGMGFGRGVSVDSVAARGSPHRTKRRAHGGHRCTHAIRTTPMLRVSIQTPARLSALRREAGSSATNHRPALHLTDPHIRIPSSPSPIPQPRPAPSPPPHAHTSLSFNRASTTRTAPPRRRASPTRSATASRA